MYRTKSNDTTYAFYDCFQSNGDLSSKAECLPGITRYLMSVIRISSATQPDYYMRYVSGHQQIARGDEANRCTRPEFQCWFFGAP